MELVLAWLLLSVLPLVFSNPDAKRLYDDLLSNYNRLIRPVGNNSDRLTVKMGLRLSQLIDVVSTPLGYNKKDTLYICQPLTIEYSLFDLHGLLNLTNLSNIVRFVK